MSGYNTGQPSTRKPHNYMLGYVFERKHPLGHIVCFVSDLAGIDCEDKYVVTIEAGADSVIGPSFSSVPKAREFVKRELEGKSGYSWT